MKLPPLPWLQAFEASARHENFSAAAKELGLSQSAVSHRIRSLEAYLGRSLFERLARGLHLTKTGEAYLIPVRHFFEGILGATSGIFGARGGAFLTVRAPLSYTVLWLTIMIERFHREFPHIEFRVMSSVWSEHEAGREADIEFKLGYGVWPGYESRFLFSVRYVPVCSPELLLKMGGPVSGADLARFPLIHTMAGEDYWGRYFQEAGIRRGHNSHDVMFDSSMAVAEQACYGRHIAILGKNFSDHYIEQRRLVEASPDFLKTGEAFYFLRPEELFQPKPESILFEKWLFEQYGITEKKSEKKSNQYSGR